MKKPRATCPLASGSAVESMGDDNFAYSASFAVDGDKVTFSLMGVSAEKTPVAKVPAYMAGISCK